MSWMVLLDAALVAFSVVLAFALPKGARKGSHKFGRLVAIATPLALVIADRSVWAATEKGLLDHLTCAVVPIAKSCTNKTPEDLEAPVANADLKDLPFPIKFIEGRWSSKPGRFCDGPYIDRIVIEDGELHRYYMSTLNIVMQDNRGAISKIYPSSLIISDYWGSSNRWSISANNIDHLVYIKTMKEGDVREDYFRCTERPL